MTTIIENRTPGTRLWWSNVREWCDCGYALNRRRLSRKRNRDLETRGMCMPLDLIYRETDLEAVDLVLPAWPHWHPSPTARTAITRLRPSFRLS